MIIRYKLEVRKLTDNLTGFGYMKINPDTNETTAVLWNVDETGRSKYDLELSLISIIINNNKDNTHLIEIESDNLVICKNVWYSLPYWVHNDWVKKDGTPVAYSEYYKEISNLIPKRLVIRYEQTTKCTDDYLMELLYPENKVNKKYYAVVDFNGKYYLSKSYEVLMYCLNSGVQLPEDTLIINKNEENK